MSLIGNRFTAEPTRYADGMAVGIEFNGDVSATLRRNTFINSQNVSWFSLLAYDLASDRGATRASAWARVITPAKHLALMR